MLRKWSLKPKTMMFVYEMCLVLIEFDIQLCVEWASSINNKWADALSRLKLESSKQLNEIYKLNLHQNPIQCKIKKDFTFIKNKKLKAYYKTK